MWSRYQKQSRDTPLDIQIDTSHAAKSKLWDCQLLAQSNHQSYLLQEEYRLRLISMAAQNAEYKMLL